MQGYLSSQVRMLLPVVVLAALAISCMHDAQRVGLYPATDQAVDVFTCKGLDEDSRWTGITDQFLPDVDPYVIVAAQLRPEHRESRVVYELTSPAEFVVISESMRYPKETDLGIHFDMRRLMEAGGEGEWCAAVYADGMPLGKAKFNIGEERKELAEVSRYAIVGREEEPTEPTAEEMIESATQSLSPDEQAGSENADFPSSPSQ